MAAQMESFAKPTKEFVSAKKKLDDISTRIEGCEFGRQQLKARIADRLGLEAKQRLEQIEEELATISDKEKELNQKYLDSAARTAVIRESIRGLTLSHDTRGNYQTSTPSLKVELHLMDLKDGEIYSDRVEHYRREMQVGSFGGTIRGRQDDLTQERNRLERSLQSDPLANAEELLNRLNPPAPEPAVVAESSKSHPVYESKVFERDYGNEETSPEYDRKRSPARGIPGSESFSNS